MEELWQYITKKQPELKSHLLPGASLGEIQSIEDSLGVEFPAMFRDCYLIHNGLAQSRFIDYWRLFPLKEITEIWDFCKKLRVCDDLDNEYKWNPKWIPFGSNMSGNLICFNLDPTTEDAENVPEGFSRFGELFIYFQDEKRVTSQNIEFHEWFENFMGSYEETD